LVSEAIEDIPVCWLLEEQDDWEGEAFEFMEGGESGGCVLDAPGKAK